jgi:L-alanine-DL-glutamate epimerase-like enolase superfamily enzyme
MSQPTDIRIVDVELYFLPVQTRMPLKFGAESLESVVCARAKVTVENGQGHRAVGWGETPLSVQWVWPSTLTMQFRLERLQQFATLLAAQVARTPSCGHAMEIGLEIVENVIADVNVDQPGDLPQQKMPYLAKLVVASVFDQAIHDAYGNANDIDIYQAYGKPFLNRPVSEFFIPCEIGGETIGENAEELLHGRFLDEFIEGSPPKTLPVWHLVGGLDPISPDELTSGHPDDGYPVLLADWIKADGLECLKIKLRGNDSDWDFRRLVEVGLIGMPLGVKHLSADFNCMVREVDYVNQILDRLKTEHRELWESILYVEQPFPHELEELKLDVHSLSNRKPLFLDESAHDWRYVEYGRRLGWSGVALKTCKTQTGALLSMCWAKVNQMPLMVQDLTNPMLAQVPHTRLAAHSTTIMGVESNAMQFYPDASMAEAQVHPGLYKRSGGKLDLSSVGGSGFGYRVTEIDRMLPAAVKINSTS